MELDAMVNEAINAYLTDPLSDRSYRSIAGGSSRAAVRIVEKLNGPGRFDGTLHAAITEQIEAGIRAGRTRSSAPGASRSKPRALPGTPAPAATREVLPEAFLLSLVSAASDHPAGPRAPALLQAVASGIGETVPSEGGFVVPPAQRVELWDRLHDESLIGLTDKYEVPFGQSSITLAGPSETTRSGSVYGGQAATWYSEEGLQLSGTKPKVRACKLEPAALYTLTYCTEKLLLGAPEAAARFIGQSAAAALAAELDRAIVRGDGVGKPLGLLNSGGLVTVAAEGGQAAATVLPVNVAKMVARLHPACHRSAGTRWLMHPSVFAQVLALYSTTAAGAAGSNLYDPATRTLAGFPIYVTDACSALGTVGDVILADLNCYVTGTKSGGFPDVSAHARFLYAEQAFRYTLYTDGQPWLSSPITPAVGSDTVTTHVALATRS